MTLEDQKESFSRAWVRAVAAAVGFGVHDGNRPDDQSVDLTLSARRQGIVSNPRLDFQLKCTATDLGTAPEISFALKQKNYDDLRDPRVSVPIILVLLHVPLDPINWIVAGDNKLELFKSAWWISLRGYPAVANEANTTVKIRRTQRFTPEALRQIMASLANGQLP